MTADVHLRDGTAAARVLPDEGAAVATFDVAGAPVLHPRGTNDPGGLFPLLPWSNRISGGGFTVDGVFHPLAPNAPGEPFPIHGNAWQSRWRIAAQDGRRVLLTLASEGPAPFAYRASLLVTLRRGTLSCRLGVTSTAAVPLPYGLGFHPSFVRSAGGTLEAPAEHVWLEDARHLPTSSVPVAERPAWDFRTPRPLPGGWINNAFAGWSGEATLREHASGRTVHLTASRRLRTLVVYTPDAAAPFVCIEPVSHAVDAHNRPGAPGLVRLGPGESASASLTIAAVSDASGRAD